MPGMGKKIAKFSEKKQEVFRLEKEIVSPNRDVGYILTWNAVVPKKQRTVIHFERKKKNRSLTRLNLMSKMCSHHSADPAILIWAGYIVFLAPLSNALIEGGVQKLFQFFVIVQQPLRCNCDAFVKAQYFLFRNNRCFTFPTTTCWWSLRPVVHY